MDIKRDFYDYEWIRNLRKYFISTGHRLLSQTILIDEKLKAVEK